MNIRLLTKTEFKDIIDFIWRVFLEFEAVNYSVEGKKAFYNVINDEEYLNMLTSYGAFIDDKLVGIIDYLHPLTNFLLQYGGNIGYSVLPSERKKGYAKEMLKQMLRIC